MRKIVYLLISLYIVGTSNTNAQICTIKSTSTRIDWGLNGKKEHVLCEKNQFDIFEDSLIIINKVEGYNTYEKQVLPIISTKNFSKPIFAKECFNEVGLSEKCSECTKYLFTSKLSDTISRPDFLVKQNVLDSCNQYEYYRNIDEDIRNVRFRFVGTKITYETDSFLIIKSIKANGTVLKLSKYSKKYLNGLLIYMHEFDTSSVFNDYFKFKSLTKKIKYEGGKIEVYDLIEHYKNNKAVFLIKNKSGEKYKIVLSIKNKKIKIKTLDLSSNKLINKKKIINDKNVYWWVLPIYLMQIGNEIFLFGNNDFLLETNVFH